MATVITGTTETAVTEAGSPPCGAERMTMRILRSAAAAATGTADETTTATDVEDAATAEMVIGLKMMMRMMRMMSTIRPT